jgi:hypothetical protein
LGHYCQEHRNCLKSWETQEYEGICYVSLYCHETMKRTVD